MAVALMRLLVCPHCGHYVPHKSIFTIMEVYDAPSTFKCHSAFGCKRDREFDDSVGGMGPGGMGADYFECSVGTGRAVVRLLDKCPAKWSHTQCTHSAPPTSTNKKKKKKIPIHHNHCLGESEIVIKSERQLGNGTCAPNSSSSTGSGSGSSSSFDSDIRPLASPPPPFPLRLLLPRFTCQR